MEPKEIKELVDSAVKGAFTEMEISKNLEELKRLRIENKDLLEKLSSVEHAEIPAEKVDEITSVVEKAVGDKVDSLVGEVLEKAVEKLDEKVNAKFEEFKPSEGEEEAPEDAEMEEAMTDRQRIKEALSNKKGKKLNRANAFKPMSRQSRAYTQCSDVEKELEAITEALKNAKSKKEVEEVKNLLQAFITSSKKISVSEDLGQDDKAELEAYRELGTLDEIEAAVEVIETYAEEIGSMQELKSEQSEELSSKKKALASKKRKLLSRRRALASRRRALASRRRALASKKKESNLKAREVQSSSKETKVEPKKETKVSARRKALIEARKKALASKKENSEKTVTTENSSRIERIKALKERRVKLAGVKDKIKENLETSTASKNTPGALATALFKQK